MESEQNLKDTGNTLHIKIKDCDVSILYIKRTNLFDLINKSIQGKLQMTKIFPKLKRLM